MRASAKFPAYLIRYIYAATIYLCNRTPQYRLFWQTPIEVYYTFLAFRDGISVLHRRPNQAHLKAYGCKAFVLIKGKGSNTDKLHRMNPRGWIGYLVGYRSSNIYEIWNPLTHKVISTRDVAFNEELFFSGNIDELRDDLRTLDEEALRKKLERITISKRVNRNPSISEQEDDEDLSLRQQFPAYEDGVDQEGPIEDTIVVRQRVYCLMMHVLVHSVDSGTRSRRRSSSYTSRGSTDRSTCRD